MPADYPVIRLDDYELSGGGKLGESYTHRTDPDVLLKLYPPELEPIGLEEYARASKVYRIGVPCPEPGRLVRAEDGRLCIVFKRIVGKKSYARALSEHPERLKQYAADFARVCRQLHALKPGPGLFPTAKEQYKQAIARNPFLSKEELDALMRFIDGLPDADTALHGDLHHGNVIFTEDGSQYLIDLSDFCTGTPLFDLGIFMLQACWIPDELSKELYHIDVATARAFWEAFVPEYFGPDVPLEEVEEQVRPYALLRTLVCESVIGEPLMETRQPIRAMVGL